MRAMFWCVIVLGLALSDTACADKLSGIWVVRAPATWPAWIRNWIGENYGISFVEDGRKVCGLLSWIKDVSDGGHVETDHENPNPMLRTRSLLGLTIATGLSEQSGNIASARFYFPPTGTYHSITISIERADAMSATVRSADVVLKYGWCPLCWEFKEIALEKRMPSQLPPPIKGGGCHFQE
jgi:hypothetical protein